MTQSRRKHRALVWSLAFFWPALAAAAPEDDARRECDRAEAFTVLQASAGPADARALWLDRRELQWPGAAVADGIRFRLYHSATGRMQAMAGEAVQAADQ